MDDRWHGAADEGPALGADPLGHFLGSEAGDPRQHHVTALVLAHEGAPWLPRTLHAIHDQVRAPDRVIALDGSSSDDSQALLRSSLDQVVTLDPDAGLVGALAAGVARTQVGAADPDDPVLRWLWIIHDDSAPEPGCLQALLSGSDRNPAATILVPKTVSWSDPGRLVGIGHLWAPGTPLATRLEVGERDQGQFDVDRPVYAGNSAGMLISLTTWTALHGMDPGVGGWAAPADLCRRAWGSGGEVVFIPEAVLAHRQAGRRGVRRGSPDEASPRRAERHGQLILELSQAPAAALPWRWLRAWVVTLLKALALVVTRGPLQASAEVRGAWDVMSHPRRLARARRNLRRPPVTTTARPAHVRAPRGAMLGRALDTWSQSLRALRRRFLVRPPRSAWLPLGVAGALAAAAVIRNPGVLLGSGDLSGGGLLPAGGAMEVLRNYLVGWQDVRLGVPTSLPAYLPLLSAASIPLLGSVDLLLRLAFGLAVPLAFLSAYLSIGSRTAPSERAALALAWSVLPAAVAASGGGRLSTLAVLLLGPPTARLVARALTRRPGAGLRPAVAAGTLLGVVAAFAPGTYLLVVLAGALVWAATGRPRWPLRSGAVIAGVAGTFLLLWIPRLLAAPGLLLSDLGRNSPALAVPGPWPWGLSPGGPSSLAWPGVPLVVVAIIAVAARGRTAWQAGGLAAAALLLVGAAWLPALPDPAVPPWPGQPLLIAGGLLALLAARGISDATGSRSSAGRARPPAHRALRWAWWGAVATLVVGWLAAPVDLQVRPSSGLPPVVALDAATPDRPRALVLSRAPGDDPGAVRYGVGGTAARIGDADALAAPWEDPQLADAVGSLVSGAGLDVEAALGGRGIRYVVLHGSPSDPLAAELDATAGLRRLSSAADQALWLVAGQPVRAELLAGRGQGSVPIPVLTSPTQVEVVIHPDTPLRRTLLVAERFDPGWRAQLDGQPLDLGADDSGMTTGRVVRTGRLVLEHRSVWSILAVAHLVVLAALVVLCLPRRRVADPDGESRP